MFDVVLYFVDNNLLDYLLDVAVWIGVFCGVVMGESSHKCFGVLSAWLSSIKKKLNLETNWPL